jgi:hypothetical protein
MSPSETEGVRRYFEGWEGRRPTAQAVAAARELLRHDRLAEVVRGGWWHGEVCGRGGCKVPAATVAALAKRGLAQGMRLTSLGRDVSLILLGEYQARAFAHEAGRWAELQVIYKARDEGREVNGTPEARDVFALAYQERYDEDPRRLGAWAA